MKRRILVLAWVVLLPAALAHEVEDPRGDQLPPVDYADIVALRLAGNDSVVLEVEVAAEPDGRGWYLQVHLDRGDGMYWAACSFPERGCLLQFRQQQLHRDIPVETHVEGAVVRMSAPFVDWAGSPFRVEGAEVRVWLQAGTDQAEVTAPESSDALEAAVDWPMAPAHLEKNMSRPATEDPAPTKRTPFPGPWWLAFAGVRRR